jgi:hypothetical protein
MIFLSSLIPLNGQTNQNNNFHPVVVNGRICFSFSEGKELLEIVKLHPINTALIQKYQENEKLNKKRTRKQNIIIGVVSGCVGLLAGSVGTGILIFKVSN